MYVSKELISLHVDFCILIFMTVSGQCLYISGMQGPYPSKIKSSNNKWILQCVISVARCFVESLSWEGLCESMFVNQTWGCSKRSSLNIWGKNPWPAETQMKRERWLFSKNHHGLAEAGYIPQWSLLEDVNWKLILKVVEYKWVPFIFILYL